LVEEDSSPRLKQCGQHRGLPACSIHPFGRSTPTSQTDRQTDRQDKPVCFYGPIAPPVPNARSSNAPISECPRAAIAARGRAGGSIRISRQAPCCCSSAIAGIAIGANFKIYLLRQFCSNRVQIFLQHTGDTDAKKLWTRILKFEFCDFLRIFGIFKKASSGPSVADLDHYGRGQTRSE